jgi:hypothetical protein
VSTPNEINTRIKLKRDTEARWEAASNKTILNGEVILVDCADGRLRAKIGDGTSTSTYGQLEFLDIVHVITEENKDEDIPTNAIIIVDTTEADLTGSITGGGNGNSGTGTGADGYSPTVTITTITGGHRVAITDVNGTKSFNVMNGKDGSDGQDGKSFTYADFTQEQLELLRGPAGQDGTTPVKGTHYCTAADKSEIINEVLSQLPDGNEVAY